MQYLPAALLLAAYAAAGPAHAAAQDAAAPPRLVVVIAVDQLRSDYLARFGAHFGTGGFRRLVEQGATFTESVFEHAVTKTCPGHAVMLTGAHASETAIVGNDWWNRASGRVEYCAFDAASPLVGAQGEGRSPRRLAVPTLGDMLKLATSGRSRVVAVGGKDRSAIMLGGHLADAAYWASDTLFVTSRYYADALPEWVRRYNASGAFTRYFGQQWERALPGAAYAMQGEDDAAGERNKAGMGRAFPHPLGRGAPQPGAAYVEALEYSPFHNELVVEFALDALREERLGTDEIPDILAIALSANDRVGHAFGPHSHEVLDATVRTDRLLERLLDALDEQVGLENVVVVLTSDHGVAPLPESVHGAHAGAPAGRIAPDSIARVVDRALSARIGAAEASWVSNAAAPYAYLNHAALRARNANLAEAASIAKRARAALPGLHDVYTWSELESMRAAGARSPMVLAFHPAESGDVMYSPAPFTILQSDADGTTHGSPWLYDRQVPIVFFGAGIRPGRHAGTASVADIAPTLAALLRVAPPPAATGRVQAKVLKNR